MHIVYMLRKADHQHCSTHCYIVVFFLAVFHLTKKARHASKDLRSIAFGLGVLIDWCLPGRSPVDLLGRSLHQA